MAIEISAPKSFRRVLSGAISLIKYDYGLKMLWAKTIEIRQETHVGGCARGNYLREYDCSICRNSIFANNGMFGESVFC